MYLTQSETARLHRLIDLEDVRPLTPHEKRERNALMDQWNEAEDRAYWYARRSECDYLMGLHEDVRDVVGGL